MSICINTNPQNTAYAPAVTKGKTEIADFSKLISTNCGKNTISTNFSAGSQIVLKADALYSGASPVNGGIVSIAAYKSEKSTPENPIMLVKVLNPDGTAAIEEEVQINKIDPRNASLIEMYALNGRNAELGLPHIPIDTFDLASLATGNIKNRVSDPFTKTDFLAPLIRLMEFQRYHNNFDGYVMYKSAIDTILDLVEKK